MWVGKARFAEIRLARSGGVEVGSLDLGCAVSAREGGCSLWK